MPAPVPYADCADMSERGAKVKQIFRETHVRGFLTFAEVRTLLVRCVPAGGQGLSEADIRTLFDAVDTNGRGIVEFDTFMDFLLYGTPMPLAPAAPKEEPPPPLSDEAAEASAVEIRKLMGADASTRVVCVLGSASFSCPDTAEMIAGVAEALSAKVAPGAALFVTGGMPGAQQAFSRAFGDARRLWHVVPGGGFPCASPAEGAVVEAAGTCQQHKQQVLGRVGDVYLTFEGGPGVAKEARLAVANTAIVVPVRRTGGASSGMFDFPAAAFERPDCVDDETWALLESAEAPLQASIDAIVQVVVRLVG